MVMVNWSWRGELVMGTVKEREWKLSTGQENGQLVGMIMVLMVNWWLMANWGDGHLVLMVNWCLMVSWCQWSTGVDGQLVVRMVIVFMWC